MALLYVVMTAVYMIGHGSMDRSKEVVWSFMKQVNAGNRAALQQLGPAAVFDDEPVSEDEAEAKYADFYLRHPELIVREVRAGEPDAMGKQKSSPGRYTLVTKVSGSTPFMRVRNRNGEVDPPSQLSMQNPLLVVEVKDGKIHGVRTDLNRE